MKVAIIEDEKSIINSIEVAFEFRWPNVSVVSAENGKDGIELVKYEHPDLVILDINLPDISGFEVLKNIRAFSSLPVIILTVRFDDLDVIKGLEIGADDYIVKPFNYLTLLARVKAVLRRNERISLDSVQNMAMSSRLNVDFINQQVRIDNAVVKLTPIEYRLLILLVKNRNKVVPNQQIMEELWGHSSARNTENIRIYIRRLRKILGDLPPTMILNQHGSGYIFKS
jgi:two-component system KDP operon response regulator KdpE